MARGISGRRLSVPAVIATIFIACAPALPGIWRLLRLPLVGNGADAATHFVRMMHARDLYLASGHHWGWDPFWFQGYVPFLLYPHLTYVALALTSMVAPIDPARLFNAYTVALYFGLPLIAALSVLRSSGLAAAVVLAAWVTDLNTPYGAGFRGVFHMSLLSQQAGLCLFAALAHELILTRRIDRAALWLGIIPLVHVHTSVLAGMAWLVEGLRLACDRRNPTRPLREWLVGSAFALLISLPTLAGVMQGWDQVGASTTFLMPSRMFDALLSGALIAPWQAVAAIILGLVAGVIWTKPRDRGVFIAWLALGAFYVAVSVQDWQTGVDVLDRVLHTMLRLRSMPFAFLWLAILAASAWPRSPAVVRISMVALTIAGVVAAWPLLALHASRIGSPWQDGERRIPVAVYDYHATLDWIADDVGQQTTTVAICVPPRTRRGLPLMTAIERIGLPLLGGHGIELTPVHNARFTSRTLSTDCEDIREQVEDYAVGYIVGATLAQREHFKRCLDREPAFQQGSWWVFATGARWHSIAPTTFGFLHNDTWTELHWYLRAGTEQATVRLPIANTAPWSADIDGAELPIETSPDGMMSVTVPATGGTLSLRYRGYAGEWTSVIVSLGAFAVAFVRIRRRSRAERT